MEQLHIFDDGIGSGRDTQQDVQHANITVKIRNFSNEQLCRQRIYYDIESEYPSCHFSVTINTNGWKNVERGYVSVRFRDNRLHKQSFVFSCFICILDVDGNKRFTKSFSYNYNKSDLRNLTDKDWPFFGIDKYISHKILLKEPSELLPNDILSLNIDIIVVEQREVDIAFNLIKSSFKTEGNIPERRHYLCLDSVVAKHLRSESRYFERLLDISMKENETRYMSIPVLEYSSFIIIARFMIGVPVVEVNFVDDIFQLYAVADKYDIPMVTANCLLLLRAYLSVDSAEDLIELADDYFHDCDHLKESIKELLKRRDEDIEVIRDLKEQRRFREWRCEVSESYVRLLFKSNHTSLPAVEEEIPASAFDFYN